MRSIRIPVTAHTTARLAAEPSVVNWRKRMSMMGGGVALFFLLKGLVWLAVSLLAARYFH